ncbi:hypothetical protein OKW47_005939 [Paraburkholderia atlantica]
MAPLAQKTHWFPLHTGPRRTQCGVGWMTALSLPSNVRGHGFQMHHCRLWGTVPA